MIRISPRQFVSETWPFMTGPIVVSVPGILVNNNTMTKIIRQFAGNRDGPLIFHLCGGRPMVTGPPRGTGPPEIFSSGTGPPKTPGSSMEWLVEKKEKYKTVINNEISNSLEKMENIKLI